MSLNDKNNSTKIYNGANIIKNIYDEFEFSKNVTDKLELYEYVFNFFKTFSSYISSNKNPSQKLKFSPELFDAKNDNNVAKIYEKDGKLYLKNFNYENEFDKFYTHVNKIKEQKRKTIQSLKNGSLVYEIPLYKTLKLNELNNKLYEDAILNSEIKYDVFNSIFFPENDRFLNKDDDFIFNLNQKMAYNPKGVLLFNEDKENYTFVENEEIDKKEKDKEKAKNKSNINIDNFFESNIISKKSENKTDNININNNNNSENVKNKKKSIFFKNDEINVEITKYNNFIQENISIYLLNLSNHQNSREYLENSNNLNNNIGNIIGPDKFHNLKDIIKATDNIHILELINHFNNIFTPKQYNQFSLYKNIRINNPSQFLNDANNIFIDENEMNSSMNKEEEGLMKDIKQYFDEELVKEINKDIEITQNFTHFYIEGNKFSKENMKKIVSFLSKENFYMFAWYYNKEETKKFGLTNNIVKVANLSDKVWFYINIKKAEDKKK